MPPNKCLKSAPNILHNPAALKDAMFKMLFGDHYWHETIRRILASAGFITRRIERMESHPVWTARLTRTTFDLSSNPKTANKQLRKVLAKGGIKLARDEFDIINRRGDNLRCVFLLDLGGPGVA